jgi:hypothetical protein
LAADIGFSFPSLRLDNPNFDAGPPLDNLRIVSSDFHIGEQHESSFSKLFPNPHALASLEFFSSDLQLVKQQHESSSSDSQHGKQQHEPSSSELFPKLHALAFSEFFFFFFSFSRSARSNDERRMVSNDERKMTYDERRATCEDS